MPTVALGSGCAAAKRPLPGAAAPAAERDADAAAGAAGGADAAQATSGASRAAQRRKTAKLAERQAAERSVRSAMGLAAQVAFASIAGAEACGDEEHAEAAPHITAAALRAALARYRVPAELCKPEEVETMLSHAAELAGESPGALGLATFERLVAGLDLKVTKEGRVW